MNDTPTRYYGKYRGTVINNVDPEQRGRIQAMVELSHLGGRFLGRVR
jgi:hypothetical protein